MSYEKVMDKLRGDNPVQVFFYWLAIPWYVFVSVCCPVKRNLTLQYWEGVYLWIQK